MAQAERNRGISATVDALFDARDLVRSAVPVVERGQELGQLRPGPPLALALALFSAVQGLAEELAVHPEYPVPPTQWYLDLVRAPGGAS